MPIYETTYERQAYRVASVNGAWPTSSFKAFGPTFTVPAGAERALMLARAAEIAAGERRYRQSWALLMQSRAVHEPFEATAEQHHNSKIAELVGMRAPMNPAGYRDESTALPLVNLSDRNLVSKPGNDPVRARALAWQAWLLYEGKASESAVISKAEEAWARADAVTRLGWVEQTEFSRRRAFVVEVHHKAHPNMDPTSRSLIEPMPDVLARTLEASTPQPGHQENQASSRAPHLNDGGMGLGL